MTERMASGRALGALKAIGMEEAPLTTLEREDALFVLTGQTLVYQDGGGTRRVTLRDLTRIHSDEQGMLRVETPAGTALTASLLGFDVPGVQAFFAQVRDTTARAKELPVSPLPAPGALKTFGAPPLPPRPEPGQERGADDAAPVTQQSLPQQSVPQRPVTQQPASQQPGSLQPAVGQPPATLASADQRAPTPPPKDAPTPVKEAPQAEAARAQAADAERPSSERSSFQPVVTQKPPGERTQEQKAEPAAPGSERAPLPPTPRPAGTVESPPARPTPLQSSPATLPPTSPQRTPPPAAPPGGSPPAAAPARPVVISSSAFTSTSARAAAPAPEASGTPQPDPLAERELGAVAPVTPPQMLDGLHRTLARQADVVGDLVGRLRFLGGVLFAAALLLATVQFTADARLDALWTLLSGGVGTIALLALAELARLLALLGRSAALSAGIPASGAAIPGAAIPGAAIPGAAGGAVDAR